MIDITCQGKTPSEAKTKCMVTEILLTEKKVSTDTAINILNAIGGICISVTENKE